MENKKDNNNWIDSFMTEKSELKRAATSLHDFYMSYINAGFSEAQALEILKTIITIAFTNGGRNHE